MDRYTNILHEFDIDESQINAYLPDYLISHHAEQCFFVDIIPYLVSTTNSHKLKQLERKFNKRKKISFRVIENLWLYNDIYVHSELLINKTIQKKIKYRFPFLYLKYKKSFKTFQTNKIDNLELLQFLWKLSELDIIDLTIFIKQWEGILIPSWQSYFLYLKNPIYIECFSKIVSTEGFYIRQLT